MRLSSILALVSLSFLAHGEVVRGDDASSPSPAAVVEKLSAGDFNERQKAIHQLEASWIDQGAAWLDNDDIDTQAEIAKLLRFNELFTRFLMDAARWPAADRAAAINLLHKDSFAETRRKLFSIVPDERCVGVKELASVNDPATDLLLGYFLHDDATEVSLATMDVLWDRPPTRAAVNGLWKIAVGNDLQHLLATEKQNDAEMPSYQFRGGIIKAHFNPTPMRLLGIIGYPEHQAAIETLIHLRGEFVEECLNDSLRRLNERLADTASAPDLNIITMDGVIDTLVRVEDACRFASALPAFYTLSQAPLTDARQSPNFKAIPYKSVRTRAMALVMTMTAQDPSHYGMHTVRRGDNEVWEFASKEDEWDAAKKLAMWWQTNEPVNALADRPVTTTATQANQQQSVAR